MGREKEEFGRISLPKRGVRWLQPPQRHFSERFVGIGIGGIRSRYTREFFEHYTQHVLAINIWYFLSATISKYRLPCFLYHNKSAFCFAKISNVHVACPIKIPRRCQSNTYIDTMNRSHISHSNSSQFLTLPNIISFTTPLPFPHASTKRLTLY